MNALFPEWDYLIVTASNDKQAAAYRQLIDARLSLGMLGGVKSVQVVADPGGRRIGSGGSTVHSLLHVLNLELAKRQAPGSWIGILDRLRVLIVHAGGDSMRLPPYGPCGKIFVPVPGEAGGVLGTSLFDRLIPSYLDLPLPSSSTGQVVVASGDVLLEFDAARDMFAGVGITGVGARISPDVAKNHGVYCRHEDGRVRRFLQKPSVAKQAQKGAIDSHGQAILDIGILNFSPAAVVQLLKLWDVGRSRKSGRELAWRGPLRESAETTGLDIYREFCCALGTDTGFSEYVDEVEGSGSRADRGAFRDIYRGLRSLPYHVHVLPRLRFLHFGTLQDLIESGRALLASEFGGLEKSPSVILNTRVTGPGKILGKKAWVEGCRVEAPLTLAGDNVVVGVDIGKPLALPRGRSLDVIPGTSPPGRQGWIVRAYSIHDVFHLDPDHGARLCDLPVMEWIEAMDADPADIWKVEDPAEERTVWNGRFFPFVREKAAYRNWLFLLEPRKASRTQKSAWHFAERWSLAEAAVQTDLDSFHSRRWAIRSEITRNALSRALGPTGELSASDIEFLIRNADQGERKGWFAAMAQETIRTYRKSRTSRGLASLELSRILHTIGSVLSKSGDRSDRKGVRDIGGALKSGLKAAEKKSLRELGLPIEGMANTKAWAGALNEAAFRHLSRTIIYQGGAIPTPPRNVLRGDEIVWGRAPARLDLGGGWTDTPPYSLERGGCVINAAVNLNGQAPIQAYARVIGKREIRINSIDHGKRMVIKTLEELQDYRQPGSHFALAKAALSLAGFAPEAADWPAGIRTLDGMLRCFGGGIELTTLAAIPSGSGLGTSSIMGAVLISIISRVIGRPLAPRELFLTVLKLEQALTTGGGWQDQIGGAIQGVKMITTEKGLVPNPRIHFVPADLLDPAANDGRTLLYYTGLRRLAKNILHEVVGRYLDRDRSAMMTMKRLHEFPPMMAQAMSKKDPERFGELIDIAWRLNVDLDPDHSTPVIEELRARVRPHVSGAKLLGAGGGGFLLLACKSAKDAAAVKRKLEAEPPNDNARFFEYSINQTGLVVTVC